MQYGSVYVSVLIYKAFEASKFSHSCIVCPAFLANNLKVVELFHGPTLAFKDLSIRCLAEFVDYFLTRQQKKLIVLVGKCFGCWTFGVYISSGSI